MYEPPTQQASTPAYRLDPAAPAAPHPSRPAQAKVNWKRVVLGIVGAFAAAGLAVAALFAIQALSSSGKADDVRISSCSTGGGSTADVEVLVTNSSSSRRSYVVSVEVTWLDRRMGTASAGVPEVAPGQTVRQWITVPVAGNGDECVITSVS